MSAPSKSKYINYSWGVILYICGTEIIVLRFRTHTTRHLHLSQFCKDWTCNTHPSDCIAHALFGIYTCLGIIHWVSTNSPIVHCLTLFTAWCNHNGQCFIKWHCNECATAAIGRQWCCLSKRHSPDLVRMSYSMTNNLCWPLLENWMCGVLVGSGVILLIDYSWYILPNL